MLDVHGPAVLGDFFALTGTDFPQNSTVVFRPGSGRRVAMVRPDLARPHWLLVGALPSYVTPGENEVWVEGDDGWATAKARVEVRAYGPTAVRVLYPGAPSVRPYTIAFVANPAIRTGSGAIVEDPVLTDRPAFHRTVVSSLQALFTRDEDLLRAGGLDRLIRLVTVFDHRADRSEANALTEEYVQGPVMGPRRDHLVRFLEHRGIQVDVAFAIYGSASHPLPTSNYTTDAQVGPQVPWTYDDTVRSHGVFTAKPGTVALSIHLNPALPYALHEFAHAVSECERGVVLDAYVEYPGPDFPVLIVNKKYRSESTAQIPALFCTYGLNGDVREYRADRKRDGLGYPVNWTSYHPEAIDPEVPNLMDDFRHAKYNMARCRFDRLTYQWLRDRLWAKANR